MKRLFFLLILIVLSCVACGAPKEKNECGDGKVTGNELCDVNASGAQACPSEATCRSKSNACTTYELQGSTCMAQCVATKKITTCQNGDGCCPAGCAGRDSDCNGNNPCGDGQVTGSETCDTGLEDGNPSKCLTQEECTKKTTDACRPFVYSSPAACQVSCEQKEIKLCLDGDGCCPSGCEGVDSDCTLRVKNVGAECNQNSDCGHDGICKLLTRDDHYRGGYCTGDCSVGKCPEGSRCYKKGKESFCHKGCRSADDCRDKKYYDCVNVLGGTSELPGICLPKRIECTGDQDCESTHTCTEDPLGGKKHCFEIGKGSLSIGEQCERVSSCSGGKDAECLAMPGTLFSVCTQECDSKKTCPTGSTCSSVDQSDKKYCLKTCTADSDCGGDLLCLTAQEGGSEKVCKREFKKIGAACTENRECASHECLTEAATNLKKGYCTKYCSKSSSPCPDGAYCVKMQNQGVVGRTTCMQTCQTESECRTADNFSCVEISNTSTHVCWSL